MNLAIDYLGKSDNLISMETKYLTATEVARNFSAVLDEVENGQEIVVLRGKVAIAKLTPAGEKKPNGAKILALLEEFHAKGHGGPNKDFDDAMAIVAKRRDEQRVVRTNPWDKY